MVGLKAIDVDIMNGVLKMKWLQLFIKNGEEIRFTIPSLLFKKLGDIDFFVKISKVSFTNKSYWKIIYTHNFSPHNVLLWNNRVIWSKRKSIFMDNWMEKQIWWIVHLLDESGNLLKLD